MPDWILHESAAELGLVSGTLDPCLYLLRPFPMTCGKRIPMRVARMAICKEELLELLLSRHLFEYVVYLCMSINRHREWL